VSSLRRPSLASPQTLSTVRKPATRKKTRIVFVSSFGTDRHPVYLSALRILRRTNRFADVMLFAWSEVEQSVDLLVAWDFGLKNVFDERTEVLSNLPFWRKISLLQKRGILRKRDLTEIQTFQKTRNSIFHRGGRVVLELDLEKDNKREKMMTNAIATMQVLYAAELRCLRAKRKLHAKTK